MASASKLELIGRKWSSLRFRARMWARAGALPNTLIIGAGKAGTTSLFEWLSLHPLVCPSRVKEIRFFDHNYHHGRHWYSAHFSPQPHHRVVLEASPSYLWNAPVPPRVSALLGAPKLIVLLREPVDRAYSHYAMKRARGLERLTFEEALEAEPERLARFTEGAGAGEAAFIPPQQNFGYFSQSLYAEQIERWLAVFPRDGFLFLKAEDLFRDPDRQMLSVLEFLSLDRLDVGELRARNVGEYPPIDPRLRDRLRERFAEPNRRLEKLTGVTWP